ncbi:MAG: aspartate-semialdehyde dehydrogenase [Erythrobacter sp.]
MRRLACLLAVLPLAACDSGTVPSPADRQNGQIAESGEVARDFVALHGEGLVAGTEAFYFAAGRSEVERALEAALGPIVESSENPECGAGPIESSQWPGGLTVNFHDGNLVGWTLREGARNIQIDADVAIGTPRSTAEDVSGYTPIEDSTLGEEFALGENLGGFIEGDTVTMLYAGTQCFFR